MKKKNLKNLELNTKVIANLQMIGGGANYFAGASGPCETVGDNCPDDPSTTCPFWTCENN